METSRPSAAQIKCEEINESAFLVNKSKKLSRNRSQNEIEPQKNPGRNISGILSGATTPYSHHGEHIKPRKYILNSQFVKITSPSIKQLPTTKRYQNEILYAIS